MPVINFTIHDSWLIEHVTYNENVTIEEFIKDYLQKKSEFVSLSTKVFALYIESQILNTPRYLKKKIKEIIQSGAALILTRKSSLFYGKSNY